MNPFECLNKACTNLLKRKGLQIIVESVSISIEADSFNLLGGWKASFGNAPIGQKTNYNVTIRLNHNFSIDMAFSEDGFDPSKPWGIEKGLKLDGLGEDDRRAAGFACFFWTLSEFLKAPKADSGPIEELVFARTKAVRQTLWRRALKPVFFHSISRL